MTKRIAVLGGGIAGITAAITLAKETSCHIDIYEKSHRLGGLIQDVKVNDIPYDIGAFIYWDGHNIFRLFPGLKSLYVPISNRPLSIRAKNKIDHFPITIQGYLRNFGLTNFALSILDLLIAKLKYRDPKNLDEYCQYYLGKRIYQKSGLKAYIKRLCGSDSELIDLRFGKQRMANLANFSFRNMLKRAYFRRFIMEGDAITKHVYARPKTGFATAFNFIEEQLKETGINILTGSEIKELSPLGQQYIIKTSNGQEIYDHVFSSLPVPITARMLGIPLPKKTFTSRHLLALFCTGELGLDTNIIYNYAEQGEWKRIINFAKYYGKENGKDFFTVEIPIEGSSRNKIDEIIAEFKDQFGPFSKDLAVEGKVIIPNAYPVFVQGTSFDQSGTLASIAQKGIHSIGRQGTFSYLSSSETIAQAEAQVLAFIEEHKEALQASPISEPVLSKAG